jgi:hypothetical protein
MLRNVILMMAVAPGFLLPHAFAQRNELAVLAGATTPGAQVSIGGFASVSAGTTLAGQLNYAHLLRESSSGSLYLEFAAARVNKASVSIDSDLVKAGVSQFVFTPGLRFKLLPASRLSPYVAGGFGFGWFDTASVHADPGFRVEAGNGIKPVFDAGGGVDFRVTRGFGLRAEVRDFVAAGTGVAHGQNVVVDFGFAFRF